MVSEAQKRAFKRYYEKTKKDYRIISVRLNKTQDGDVISKLDSVPSKTSYVRELVRKDLENVVR